MNREERIKKAAIDMIKIRYNDFKHGRKTSKEDYSKIDLEDDEKTQVMLILEFMSNISPEAIVVIEKLSKKDIDTPYALAELVLEELGIDKIIEMQMKKFLFSRGKK